MSVIYIDKQVSSQSFFLKLLFLFLSSKNKKYDSYNYIHIKQIFSPNQINIDQLIDHKFIPDKHGYMAIFNNAKKQSHLILSRYALNNNIDFEIISCLSHAYVQKLMIINTMLYNVEMRIKGYNSILFSGSNMANIAIENRVRKEKKTFIRKNKSIAILECFYDQINRLRTNTNYRIKHFDLSYYSPKEIRKNNKTILFFNSGSSAEIRDILYVYKHLKDYNLFFYIGNYTNKYLKENFREQKIRIKINNLPKNNNNKESNNFSGFHEGSEFILSQSMPIDLVILRKEYSIANQLLTIINPNAVVVGNDWISKEKIIIVLAKKKRLETFSITDGILLESIHPSFSSSCIFSFQKQKETFHKARTNNQEIVLTGSPRFNDLITSYKKNKQSSNIIGKKKTKIVFATEPGTGASNQLLKMKYEYLLFKYINVAKNEEFIIKLHPQDSGEISKHALELANKDFKIVKNIPIEQLMTECDIWICVWSTTAIEVGLLNKPVIELDFDRTYLFEQFFDNKVIFPCYDAKLIRELINKLKTIPINNKELMTKIVHEFDSAKLIAEKINEKLNK
jgi:hypothetical protein